MSASRVGLNGYFGPTANSIPRASGVGGRTLKSSGLTISDNNCLTIPGSTLTANEPLLNLSQIWNNAGVTFSGIKLNVTDSNSASGSLLADFQVGGSSKLQVSKKGQVYASGGGLLGGNNASPAFSFLAAGGPGTNSSGFDWDTNRNAAAYVRQTSIVFGFTSTGVSLLNTGSLSWSANNDALGSRDTYIYRDAANTLALRNGLNAQTLRVYNTWGNNGTDYERGYFGFLSNNLVIGFEAGGTGITTREVILAAAANRVTLRGGTNNGVRIETNGSNGRWFFDVNGHLTAITNNTYDIGGGTVLNPRNVYASTSVQVISNAGYLGIGGSAPDVFLYREAANTFAQRNGLNAQAFNIYNTYTDASNYRRLKVTWDADGALITTDRAGTGSNAPIKLTPSDGKIYPLGHLLWLGVDNTYDIGASGATRPRTGYFGTSVVAPKISVSIAGALTIATGVITVTKSFHKVDTEAAAASDDLDTINGGSEGDFLVIRAADTTHTVVLKDGTGNLKLEGDCTLDNSEDTIELIHDGTNWLELCRSNNGA